MDLKGRLKLIADKVPCCDIACDIGTDHAYIPIYLVKNGICTKAIAADVKKGPLMAASENIMVYRLSDRIETRLGDGLEPIKKGEADVFIIAGMGGVLISEILSKDMNKVRNAESIILQPMNAIEVVRQWLFDNGFDIYDEELINEGEKIYNVIAARWTGIVKKPDEIYYHIGEKLIEKKDPLMPVYLNRRLRQVETVLNEMQNTSDESLQRVRTKFEMMREKIRIIIENGQLTVDN